MRKLFPMDSYRFSMLFTIWRNVCTVNLKHIQIRHQTPSEEWAVQLLQSESPLLKPISITNGFPIGASEYKPLLKAEKQRSSLWLKNPQAGAWANALHSHTASLQAGQQSQNGARAREELDHPRYAQSLHLISFPSCSEAHKSIWNRNYLKKQNREKSNS